MVQHRLELFDPQKGNLPQQHKEEFWGIVFRARALLGEWSTDRMAEGMQCLNQILADPAFQDPIIHRIENWAPMPYQMPDGTVCEAMPGTDEVDALLLNLDRVDMSQRDESPKFSQDALFALLALSYVEQAHQAESHLEVAQGAIALLLYSPPVIERAVKDCLAIATHAITVAEGLRDQTSKIQKTITTRTSKAASARHNAQTGPLKGRVKELYLANFTHHSNRHAAKLITQELKNSGELTVDGNGLRVLYLGKPALQTDDPEGRFERWIADIKKAPN